MSEKIARQGLGFTQGLEFAGGRLLESTGALDGGTRLNAIELDGRVVRLRDFGTSFFGEGLTVFNNEIYQLSWKDHLVNVYDMQGKLLRSMKNEREGWGLAHTRDQLVFSDGSDRLFFVNPDDFAVARSVRVMLGSRPLRNLNELEYVNGKIFANVFLTNHVVRIDPVTGCVEADADLADIFSLMSTAERSHIDSDINYVLNGIAHDAGRGIFYVTGKVWRSIFAGRFVER